MDGSHRPALLLNGCCAHRQHFGYRLHYLCRGLQRARPIIDLEMYLWRLFELL